MRRSNYKLPLSTAAVSLADKFETVVVGGGVAGCLVAGKLLSERANTLVLERGCNVLQKPDWHYAMPNCVLSNRFLNPSYVHALPQSVDGSKVASILSAATGFSESGTPLLAAAAEGKSSSTTTEPTKPTSATTTGAVSSSSASSSCSSIALQTPSVLGGAHVVLGTRTWFRGVASDWEQTGLPWLFDPKMMQVLRRLEAVPPKPPSRLKGMEGWSPSTATLRGRRGIFRLSRPVQSSRLYKPLLEALVNHGCTLTSEWDPEKLTESVGAGRINNVMVDNLGGQALSTLASFLAPHLEITNCVAQGEAVALEVREDEEEEGSFEATGVIYADAAGQEHTVHTDKVVLTAGAASTARILLETQRRSKGKLVLPGAIGAGLWTCPVLTLRYSINQELSLCAASNPIVQLLAVEEWRRNGTGWGMSAFDDMVCFLNTKANGPSSVRVNVQPFMLSKTPVTEDDVANGTAGVNKQHGFQLAMTLVKPKSRGSCSLFSKQEQQSGVDCDFGALSNDDDVEALKEAADFVSKAIKKYFDGTQLGLRATPHEADLSLSGPHGGGCVAGSDAVDVDSFGVAGFSNVFVADSSLAAGGMAADMHLVTMCTAEMMHEASLGLKLGSLD